MSSFPLTDLDSMKKSSGCPPPGSSMRVSVYHEQRSFDGASYVRTHFRVLHESFQFIIMYFISIQFNFVSVRISVCQCESVIIGSRKNCDDY